MKNSPFAISTWWKIKWNWHWYIWNPLARKLNLPQHITLRNFKFLFAWYDFWIGLYFDQKKRRVYVLVFPTIGFHFDIWYYYPCHCKKCHKSQWRYGYCDECLKELEIPETFKCVDCEETYNRKELGFVDDPKSDEPYFNCAECECDFRFQEKNN